MENPWKKRAYDFNRRRAEADEKAKDLLILLDAMPPGQRKHLLEDKTCGAILRKYGITG